MAWTTPRTWTTGEVVTAAIMNTHVKSNFDVSAPAVLTTAGDILYASGANAPARLAKGTNGNIIHQASCAPAWTACPSIAGITLSGTLDVNGTADFDVTDFDVASSGDIDLTSTSNAACAIYIRANAGTSETIKIHADQGTGEGSIALTSDAGGIDLNAAAGKDITLDSGQVLVTATHNTACTIYLHANGGTSETVKIHADQGTSVTEGGASVSLLSDAGGVELRSTANLANAINITSDGGTTGSITIFNDQGSSVTEGAASIELLSDAGGVELRSTANLANAVALTSDGGTTGSILIYNDQGTTATEGSSSIQLLSDVGAVGIKSGLNAAGAIRLTADAGTSETIILHADQGSGTGSICLTSDAGGITLNPGTFVTVGANATNAAEIRMFEDTDNGCNYVAIKAPNVSTSYTMTLPTAVAGGNCYVLQSTNAGVLSWAAASAGAVSAINNATANELVTIGATTTELCAEANLTFDGTTFSFSRGHTSSLEAIFANTGTSSGDSMYVDIRNAGGGGEAGIVINGESTNYYYMGLSDGNPVMSIGAHSSRAFSNDTMRFSDAAPPVITYNTTHPTGTFDYVCDSCGKHSHERFECCGTVNWHDDVLAMRKAAIAVNTMANPYEPGQNVSIDQMVTLGVMEYDTPIKPGRPDRGAWLGLAPVAGTWFTWAGMYQNRERMDSYHAEHETQIARLTARVEELEKHG